MSLKLNIKQPLHHFNLDIEIELAAKGIVGLFGDSGCGKTSLLRAIAGLNEKSSGYIDFNNRQWQLNFGQLLNSSKKTNAQTPNIGMVFQDSRLFNHLTVAKNLSIVDKLNSSLRLASLIEDFGIEPLLNKVCGLLSAGQQQRVAIVRSLAAAPELLLLDEPLSALDNTAKQQLMLALKNYSQQHQLPMIYVSHHVDEIHYLCDELMLIEQGKIVEHGDCHAVLTNHQLLPHHSDVLSVDEITKQVTLQLSDDAFAQLSSHKTITIAK